MPVDDAKDNKGVILVINDSQEISFNDTRKRKALDEMKTPKQFQTNKILEELRKRLLLMHQLKDSGMLTDADKKNLEKADRGIKHRETQFKRLKSKAIQQKRDEKSSKQRLLQ